MSATAFVSMWVSNTSTALMLLPVAVFMASLVAPVLDLVVPAAVAASCG
jgi:di/tricarboxylate transporter